MRVAEHGDAQDVAGVGGERNSWLSIKVNTPSTSNWVLVAMVTSTSGRRCDMIVPVLPNDRPSSIRAVTAKDPSGTAVRVSWPAAFV